MANRMLREDEDQHEREVPYTDREYALIATAAHWQGNYIALNRGHASVPSLFSLINNVTPMGVHLSPGQVEYIGKRMELMFGKLNYL